MARYWSNKEEFMISEQAVTAADRSHIHLGPPGALGLQTLSREDCNRIHQASLELLQKTGSAHVLLQLNHGPGHAFWHGGGWIARRGGTECRPGPDGAVLPHTGPRFRRVGGQQTVRCPGRLRSIAHRSPRSIGRRQSDLRNRNGGQRYGPGLR